MTIILKHIILFNTIIGISLSTCIIIMDSNKKKYIIYVYEIQIDCILIVYNYNE